MVQSASTTCIAGTRCRAGTPLGLIRCVTFPLPLTHHHRSSHACPPPNSWYYVSDRGQLAFDQLPWFSVAERLEREKEALAAEREGVRAQMAAQAEVVARIEEQMQVGLGGSAATGRHAAAGQGCLLDCGGVCGACPRSYATSARHRP